MEKDKCPCGSGAAINFFMQGGGFPGVTGYDGPATIVTSKRLPTGEPVVLAKCGACERVPMFRGGAFTWVGLGELNAEERELFDVPVRVLS
jgi:hypothetical protein